MKSFARLVLAAALGGTLSACTSSDDDAFMPGTAPLPASEPGTEPSTPGSSPAGGESVVGQETSGDQNAGQDTTGAPDGSGTDGGTDGGLPPPDGGTNEASSGGDTPPDSAGDDAEPDVPFVNLDAPPVPGPDPEDPFGSLLETDNEAPLEGGAPTAPKNLRIDLVSNDWAEFSWAPSNDDEGVVAYNISRSDGQVYTVAPDQTSPSQGTQDEIDKYWQTTSFIDCNYTRFDLAIHACTTNGPSPGDRFSYQVSAVDEDGNESEPSELLTITYHAPRNAPIPVYADFYLNPDDDFAQQNDLSNTAFFVADNFDLVFEDDFDGSVIDDSKWNTQLTWGDSRIINGEQQYFVNTQKDTEFGYDPFDLADSTLTIEAVPTPARTAPNLPPICAEEDPSGNERCQFLSGALSSHDKFGMTFGYVESRMKVSGTPGALSSFYLYHRYAGAGVNRHAPEIDIIEYLGENPFGDEDAFQTYHFADVNTGTVRSAPTMAYENPEGELYSDDYHTYSVLWEPQLVIWYIDGIEIKRLTGPQVSRQQMNIVTYLVAGSAWAPTPDVAADIFPLEYEIDYIRAYQRGRYQCNNTNDNSANPICR